MLTPKNWASFQHYSDRKPAWIKLHRGLLDDFAFSRLPVASRALAPLLWLIASEYERGEITASQEELAYRLRMPVKDLAGALSPLVDAGFFLASEALAECEQSACLEKEREEEKRKNIRDVASDGFEKFKTEYPKRDGAQAWKPTAKLFDAAVKAGVDEARIIAGARLYRLECERKGIVRTDKVAQALTWVRQERWAEYDEAADAPVTNMLDAESALKLYAKTGIWSRHAPCGAPGMVDCTIPPELFTKYGLLPDGRKIDERRTA